MKSLAAYIMRGRWQAAAVASVLAFLSLLLPPASILSSATIALITLRRGAHDGFFVLLLACAISTLMGLLLLGSYLFALVYGFMLWLPVWVVSIILRESKQLSLVLKISAVFSLVSVAIAYFVMTDPAASWNQVMSLVVEPMLPETEGSETEIKQAIAGMSKYMTGLTATGFVSSLLFGLFLGRWWQSVLYNPGGFRQEYLALRAQAGFAIGSVLVVLVALFSSGRFSEIAWNLSIPLFMFYIFIGTAIAHSLLTAMKTKRYLLPIFYVLLFMIPHALVPVALIGLSDSWLNLRNRVSNHTSA
jgi:hypothetical protein